MILTVQIGFGRNALQAALISAPMPLANMAGSLLSAILLRRLGRLTVLVGAFGLMFCSILMLTITARGSGDIDVVAFIPGFMLLGFSLGISISAGVAIVLSNVPQADSGAAAGVQATGLQLSSSIGIAVFGVPFYAAVDGSQELQPYLDGLTWVMWITVALVAMQVLFTFRLPRHGAREDIELPIIDNELLVFPDLHDVDTDGGVAEDHQI
jgi:MFS family permease